MTIIELTELEDGGLELSLGLSDDEIEFLVNYAINDIIRKTIDAESGKQP